MDQSASYTQPGASLPRGNTGSPSGLAPANPVARLFARVINGAFLLFLSVCFWLATFIIIGVMVAGSFISNLWSLLRALPLVGTADDYDAFGSGLARQWETYTVGAAALDVAMVVMLPIAAAMLAFVFYLMYLTFMVRLAGGDCGHLVLGLRVVSYGSGRRPSFGQAFGRALLKQLDGLIFIWLINCIMVLANHERRHLYDLAANTIVVSVRGTAAPTAPAAEAEPPARPEITDLPRLPGNRPIPLPPAATD